jgi:hypothetical protein
MRARLALAAILVTSSLAALPSATGAATIVHGDRYARCSDPHPKTYATCPDVASKIGHYYSLEFMLKTKHCSALKPEVPGVWSYVNDLRIKRGKVTGKLDYNNYPAENQGAPDDYGIAFRWTGKFLSSKRLHLVLTAKVTSAGTSVADCAGVKFTETHDLRTVGF